jgi:hypothetical protein
MVGYDFWCGRRTVLSRFRRGDDGSIAVLAAVTFPVVLLCVALAFAAIVWSSSEHEAQRAADQAAVRAAATAFLATDFPFNELPGLTTPVTYPNAAALAAASGLTAPAVLGPCGTVGLPPGVLPNAATVPGVGGVTVGATATLSLPPAGCAGVAPFAPPVPLGDVDQSLSVACATASAAMSPEQASYANTFYKGEKGDERPTCANRRVTVKLASGSPLVGFGSVATNAVTGALDSTLAPQFAALQQALAAVGVRLDTSLPNLICPEVSVTVDQPVREPLFDTFTEPNGRATARRLVKNTVVVPVYNGRAITAPTTGAVRSSATGLGVEWSTPAGATILTPPANLNAVLLQQQRQLLALLDEVDAVADAAARAAGVSVDALNGTFTGIDPSLPQPVPAGATAPVESLRLTKCLRDTLSQVYDPPSGDAPTAQEVLADAAKTGEQVMLVQVGVVKTQCTELGAIAVTPTVAGAPDCVRAATRPQVNPLTGVYEVPFFDVTPALVQDVGNANYAAVPLHATQAAGAFRGGLVRDRSNSRYDPDVRQPRPTPVCAVTLPATGSTACQILSVSPSPSLTTPPLPLPTTVVPLPTVLPTLPVPTTTLPTVPLPTVTTSPLPTVKITLPGGLK